MKNPLFVFGLMATMLLFFVSPVFGMSQDSDVDLTNPASLVAYLSPFIILAATWLFKKMIPLLTGTWTLVFVLALSALLTFVTNALGNPDATWLSQFGLGLASVFIHQLSIRINTK